MIWSLRLAPLKRNFLNPFQFFHQLSVLIVLINDRKTIWTGIFPAFSDKTHNNKRQEKTVTKTFKNAIKLNWLTMESWQRFCFLVWNYFTNFYVTNFTFWITLCFVKTLELFPKIKTKLLLRPPCYSSLKKVLIIQFTVS